MTTPKSDEKEELKPCPFCGSKEVWLTRATSGKYLVMCDSCYCHTNFLDIEYDAHRAWNTRVHADGKVTVAEKTDDSLKEKYPLLSIDESGKVYDVDQKIKISELQAELLALQGKYRRLEGALKGIVQGYKNLYLGDFKPVKNANIMNDETYREALASCQLDIKTSLEDKEI